MESRNLLLESLQGTLQNTFQSRMTGGIETAFRESIGESIGQWLNQHPFIHWLVDHPVGAIALLITVLILFAGLLGAIARSSEHLWLLLLKVPFHLAVAVFRATGWMLGKLMPMLQQFRASSPQEWPAATATPPSAPSALMLENEQQARLQALLEQLETLRQQEDALVAEVRSLLQPAYATVSEKR